MKSSQTDPLAYTTGRSPHGGRGLKFDWIGVEWEDHPGRSPHGGRGLKLVFIPANGYIPLSLPAWGAWIEILLLLPVWMASAVAPRMGGVD